MVIKAGAAVVVATFAFIGYMSTYQTDAEAQQYQQQHNQQLISVRIQQIEMLISQYRFQLSNPGLPPAQREWLLREIDRLEAEKQCIRAGKC